jgi:Arc/MetJ-type ribon-helix-helix transcriptional regulator
VYYVSWYSCEVARTVQARLDERAEDDLALLRNEGHNDSDAIRLALREAAARRRIRSALRAEAQMAATDPDDLAEARRIREDMDAVAAPWPEP